MSKYIKMFIADIGIAVAAVVLYSPGLIALRISDESIFRAGMSVLAGLALICIFLYVNISSLMGPRPVHIEPDETYDLDQAKAILRSHMDSRVFGGIAKTAAGQLERVEKSRKRLSEIIERKFTKGTMSWDKFQGIVSTAEEAAVKNVAVMSNRMSIFDEGEYQRLQHYKEDDIPDDIQEEQLKLYSDNLESARAVIALNEKILLKLDALTVELSSFEASADADENSEILKELEKLTQDAKYYQ